MRIIREFVFPDYFVKTFWGRDHFALKVIHFDKDFNIAAIYFALITKLDIFNGSFDNGFNKI